MSVRASNNLLLIDEPFSIEHEEYVLRPFVIIWIACGYFLDIHSRLVVRMVRDSTHSSPIKTARQLLDLLFHIRNVSTSKINARVHEV